MNITDQQLHELSPPLLPAKDSYLLPFSLPSTVFPLEGLHDLLVLNPAANGSTRVLQDPPLNFAPSNSDDIKGEENANSKIRSTRKRSAGRTDRHSKICTAAGFRDRRMRLSLDAAREFFDLQDMLGFDRASETVQWLLTNSSAAIKDLMEATASNSINGSPNGELCSSSVSDIAEMKRSKKKSTSAASNALLAAAKESRAQARARARERTREKKIGMCSLSSIFRFGVADEVQDMQDLKSLCFLQERDLSSKSTQRSTKLLTSCEKQCEFQINGASGSGVAATSDQFSNRNTITSLNVDAVSLLQEQLEVDKTFFSEVQFNRRVSHTFTSNFTM